MIPAAELLCALSDLIGPSGQEGPVRVRLREWLSPLAAGIWEDALGSLFLRRAGAAGGRRLLVLVPMDEPGIVVTHIDARGRAAVAALGPLAARAVAGGRVRFGSGVTAAVGMRRSEEEPTRLAFERLHLDFGLSSREEADGVVRVGDVAVFDVRAVGLPGGQVCGKALGSRAACAAAVLALRQAGSDGPETTVAFLAQSAVGHRGVRPAVARVPADLIVSMGAVVAAGTSKEGRADVRLGAGPALVVQDRGLIASASAVDALAAAAGAAGIPLQVAVGDPGQSAAGPALMAAAGVPAGALGIPVRHLHTAAEVCHPVDVEAAAAVLTRLLAGRA